MSDPANVMVAMFAFGSVAYSISMIAKAFGRRKEGTRFAGESMTSLGEARLARIEQAVEAIALEVERISEGQRFTTKLLSEQALPAPKPAARQVSSTTPI